MSNSKQVIETLQRLLKKATVTVDSQSSELEVAKAEIQRLNNTVEELQRQIFAVSGCNERYCCMYVHFNTCARAGRCMDCNCCCDFTENERREENQRIVEQEILDGERGNLYDDDYPNECASEHSASSVDLNDLEPCNVEEEEPVRKQPSSRQPRDTHVIIHRKGKDDLKVPVEEKSKVCVCPVNEAGVTWCEGCVASKKPVPKKFVLKK